VLLVYSPVVSWLNPPHSSRIQRISVPKISPVKAIASEVENTTNGSWWIVQVPPTKQTALMSVNSTNGSWWIVQVQLICGKGQ